MTEQEIKAHPAYSAFCEFCAKTGNNHPEEEHPDDWMPVWETWFAGRSSVYGDDPEMDCTDAAHPAWWRGHDHTIITMCEHITKLLDGHPALGVCREPWEGVRRRLAALVRRAGPVPPLVTAAVGRLWQWKDYCHDDSRYRNPYKPDVPHTHKADEKLLFDWALGAFNRPTAADVATPAE